MPELNSNSSGSGPALSSTPVNRGDPLRPGETAFIDPKTIDTTQVPATDEQKKLKTLISRRHPLYNELLNHWEFCEETYEGGREWFKTNIFRYIKEGDHEYTDRVARAYRFNHTREVVDLINKYLFKQNIVRNTDDAPDCVQQFWEKSTKGGMTIKDFSKLISKKSSIFGRIGIVVDSTSSKKTEKIISKADEKKNGYAVYTYIVEPKQILDYAYDEKGNMLWILIREFVRDDADPYTSSGQIQNRYRLWTTTSWKLYKEVKNKRSVSIVLEDEGNHELGVVPVILADHVANDEEYKSQSMIDDIAYLDRAVANYLSNLDAIIQDQTYSQLAMPAQNVLPGEDNYSKLVEMGTKRFFLYDGESGTKPEYISPDVKQAELILQVVNKIISEIYHTVGLAGERTKQDNAVGIDNSSGVAKAYDFERVNALLAAKADSLENIENQIVNLVALWYGQEDEVAGQSFVSYPKNFDTRGLYDEFDIAMKLMLVDAPGEVRQQQMRMLADKLFPQLAKDLKDAIEKDIKDWPIDPLTLMEQTGELNGKPENKVVAKQQTGGATGSASDSRQGQVTKNTD